MLIPLLFALAIAGQAAPAAEDAPERGPGRFFVSPMGEPFYGRTSGEDGLIVWFQRADANHDGAITADEMVADSDRFFAMLDRAGDGEIDPDDMLYYEGVLAPQLRAQSIVTVTTRPGGETAEHVDNESASGRYGLMKIPQPVASADRNFNRGVSRDELRAAARRRFQMLDAAAAGRLTLPQLKDIRRAAAQAANRQPAREAGPSSDPNAAEYRKY
ncbi:MAG TPA: hypothetical protein VIL42_11420 [Sphingomicrobium sp.]|jgi:Ca2+-binding EF-hand superfamily protein